MRPCTGQVDLFFPAKKSNWRDVARAKAICGTCEIQPECLQGAIDRGEEHGIWGGRQFWLDHSKRLTRTRIVVTPKATKTRECSWCGTGFSSGNRRTCSTPCERALIAAKNAEAVARRTRTADCIECGASFTTTQPARKCCGDICRLRESRRRRRLLDV